jgi:hypothetical protein
VEYAWALATSRSCRHLEVFVELSVARDLVFACQRLFRQEARLEPAREPIESKSLSRVKYEFNRTSNKT